MPFDPLQDVPTLADVSPPALDYPYFEGRSAGFQSEASDYSAANAWWLAEASLLAYGSPDFIEEKFSGADLLRRDRFEFEMIAGEADTAGFVMSNAKAAIAVFRGTRVPGLQDPLAFRASLAPSLRDTIADGKFAQVPFGAGNVHSGFAAVFAGVWDALRQSLEAHHAAGRTIWFTGHSLGGGLATLAAARFGRERYQALYTYGSPRVGDAAFCGLVDGVSCFRHVHHDDIVCRLPPPFLPSLPPLRYSHVGYLVYLDRDSTVTLDADPGRVTDIFTGSVDWASVLASAGGTVSDIARIAIGGLPNRLLDIPIPTSAVTDHAPIYYAALLKMQIS